MRRDGTRSDVCRPPPRACRPSPLAVRAQINTLGTTHPSLASKMLHMIGVLALGGEFDPKENSTKVERKAKGGGKGGALGAPADGDGDGGAPAAELSKHQMEIVFQRQLAGQAQQRATLQGNLEKLQQDKRREGLVTGKLRREKEELAQKVATLGEQVEQLEGQRERAKQAEAELKRKAERLRYAEIHARILQAALEAGGVEVPKVVPFEKKGSVKMMAMLEKTMVGLAGRTLPAGADEGATPQPSPSPSFKRPPPSPGGAAAHVASSPASASPSADAAGAAGAHAIASTSKEGSEPETAEPLGSRRGGPPLAVRTSEPSDSSHGVLASADSGSQASPPPPPRSPTKEQARSPTKEQARSPTKEQGRSPSKELGRSPTKEQGKYMARSRNASKELVGADLMELIGKLYEAEGTVAQLRLVDTPTLRAELREIEQRMGAAHQDAARATARARWARGLALVAMQRSASARLGGAVKFAVTVAAAMHADARAKETLEQREVELQRAQHRARTATESHELATSRADVLREKHASLVTDHAALTQRAESQEKALKTLEHRLTGSALFTEEQREHSVRLSGERMARLEAEVSQLRWSLEQAESATELLRSELRRTRDVQHALGASHAKLDERASSDQVALRAAEARAKALEGELKTERTISQERMSSLIEERRRVRVAAEELGRLRQRLGGGHTHAPHVPQPRGRRGARLTPEGEAALYGTVTNYRGYLEELADGYPPQPTAARTLPPIDAGAPRAAAMPMEDEARRQGPPGGANRLKGSRSLPVVAATQGGQRRVGH